MKTIVSISASFDDASSRFTWLEYAGATPIEVQNPKHKLQVVKGSVVGIRQIKGNRYYMIFKDRYHLDFSLDEATGKRLLNNSNRVSQPELERFTGARAPKSQGVKLMRRHLNRTQFDADRYQPKGVPRENVKGIDLTNYQWRMINPMVLKVTHSKGYENFIKGDIIGMRWWKPSKGGYIVNRDGLWALVPADEYDSIVQNSSVLAVNDWPSGTLGADAIETYKQNRKDEVSRTEQERREIEKMRRNAEKIQQRQEEAEERARREAKRLESLKRQADLGRIVRPPESVIKIGEMKPMTDAEFRDMKVSKAPAFSDFLVDTDLVNDYDSDPLDFEEHDVERNSATLVADNTGLMDTLDTALGLDEDAEDMPDSEGIDLTKLNSDDTVEDSPQKPSTKNSKSEVVDDKKTDDEDDPDADDSDDLDIDSDSDDDAADLDSDEEADAETEEEDEGGDEAEDEDDVDDDEELDADSDEEDLDAEEDSDMSDIEEEEDDEEDEDFEEDEEDEDSEDLDADESEDLDADESEDDSEESDALEEDEDFEEDESEDGESDDPESDEDDEDFEDLDEEDSEEEDEASEEDESEDEPSDDDLNAIGDEDIGDDDADEDTGVSESDPNPKGEGDSKPELKQAEEGDVITFHDDSRKKRKWLILKIEPHKSNDRILSYTLYDLSNKAEELRQVRINTLKKQSILDIADKVSTLKAKQFADTQSKVEDYPLNKEAIIS